MKAIGCRLVKAGGPGEEFAPAVQNAKDIRDTFFLKKSSLTLSGKICHPERTSSTVRKNYQKSLLLSISFLSIALFLSIIRICPKMSHGFKFFFSGEIRPLQMAMSAAD